MLICLLVLSACVTMQAAAPGDFRSFRRAYIEAPPEDEFQIRRALVWELNDMGLDVVGAPIETPTDTDLVVAFAYNAGWDLTRYLRAFHIQFIDAKSGRVVASSSYSSTGLWRGVRDARLESAFNELRAKIGYPPTKQFQP